MTVTNRLLADLIAHVTLRTGGNFANDDRMDAYAAERLAEAEQQTAPDERRHKRDDGGDYGCHKLPAEPTREDKCPRCHGLGAIRIHYSDDGKSQYDLCPVRKTSAEPRCPKATEEAARKAAHQAAEKWHEKGDPVSYCVNAALDAFIAAMPSQYSGNAAQLNSPAPLPEEVPPNIQAECADIFAADREATLTNDALAACKHAWNAARRYSPMPPKVTEEMVIRMRDHLRDVGWGGFDTETCLRALEAALVAEPKE